MRTLGLLLLFTAPFTHAGDRSGSVHGPDYGLFDGTTTKAADPRVHELRVVSVDGELKTDLPTRVKLRPGFHWLQVASSKRGRRGEMTYQPLPLEVEPCMRYRFVAQHEKGFSTRRWQVVSVGQERRGDCKATGPGTSD